MTADPDRFSEAYLIRLLQELHRQDVARAGEVLALRRLSWSLARAAADDESVEQAWQGVGEAPAAAPPPQVDRGAPLPTGFAVQLRVTAADVYARVIIPIADVRHPFYRWLDGKQVRIIWAAPDGDPAVSDPVVLRRSQAGADTRPRPGSGPAAALTSGYVKLSGLRLPDGALTATRFGVRYDGAPETGA